MKSSVSEFENVNRSNIFAFVYKQNIHNFILNIFVKFKIYSNNTKQLPQIILFCRTSNLFYFKLIDAI